MGKQLVLQICQQAVIDVLMIAESLNFCTVRGRNLPSTIAQQLTVAGSLVNRINNIHDSKTHVVLNDLMSAIRGEIGAWTVSLSQRVFPVQVWEAILRIVAFQSQLLQNSKDSSLFRKVDQMPEGVFNS